MIVLLESWKPWALVLIQFPISCVILDRSFPFFFYRMTRVVVSAIFQIKFYKTGFQFVVLTFAKI